MQQAIEIPGFRILTELHRSAERFLVKAFDETLNQVVLLKIMNPAGNPHLELAKLKREAALVLDYELEGVAKPRNVLQANGMAVMVIEDFGNCTLRELNRHFPLPIHTFLQIAAGITEVLKQLHQKGITPSFLHPDNILYNLGDHRVKILDLENASQLDNDAVGFMNYYQVSTALAYMAPEQSGRMNRSVDSRANLYALGAIFYEMLTGTTVFPNEDSLELIHAHMAVMPTPPSSIVPGIPEVLDQIVLKLLNKNAEDRYQSAGGLLIDLQYCLQTINTEGQIPAFPVARRDVSEKIIFPQKLYGRDRELQLLLNTFEAVRKGRFAILMVGGYSGIGKSVLIQELYKPITGCRGYFISGKYDQLKKNIPYSALIQALRRLIQQVLSEPEQRISDIRRRVLQNLEGYGHLIAEVIPELELLIGKQPALPELPVVEAQNRFRDFLSKFLCSFAGPEHPLTIFIDDLQWADSSTIQLMSRLADDAENQYIYLIGAYRDNEVSPSHPLIIALQEIREKGIQPEEIILSPLAPEYLNQFLADTLKTETDETRPLSDIVQQKTGANPFFVKAFITQLAEDGLIRIDRGQGRRQWDLQKIDRLAITENVVDLLAQRMERLPAPTRDLLKTAACLGSEFDLQALSEVTGELPHHIAKNLWEALYLHFILPLSEAYKTAEAPDMPEEIRNVYYRFAHDRIQQAAYNAMEPEERLRLHLSIARLLYQAIPESELSERIFEIVNHYNNALELISDPKEKETVCLLNVRAAKRAKESVAYPIARNLYQTVIELFRPDSWENNYRETVDAYLDLAECEYLCGNYDAAENLYAYLQQQIKDPADLTRLFEINLQQFAQQGRNPEVLALGAAVLKRYGVHYIAEPSLLQVFPKLIAAKIQLVGKDVTGFVHAPKITNQEKAGAMQILMAIAATAYVYDSRSMLLLVIRMLQLSVRYGNAPESAFGYGLFGFIEGAALGNAKQCRKFSEMSMKLAAQYEDPIMRGKVGFLKAFANQHWYEPIRDAFPLLRDAYKTLANSGSYIFASYTLMTISSKELYLGLPLQKCYGNVIDYGHFTERVGETYSTNLLLTLRRYISALTGIYHEHYKDADFSLNEDVFIRYLTEKRLFMALAWHYVYGMMQHWMLGELTQAEAYRRKAGLVDDAAPTTMAQIEYYFYSLLLDVDRFAGSSPVKKAVRYVAIRRALAKLKKWANDCPANFAARYHLADAAWKAAIHHPRTPGAFALAMDLAQKEDNLCLQAVALELLGRYQLRSGKEEDAGVNLHAAAATYKEWGALLKVQQLQRQYSRFFKRGASMTRQTTSDAIDLQTVLRASQAISGEIVLNKLLEQLLVILMENVGAQRGFLILNLGNALTIEAEQASGDQPPLVLQSEPVETTDKLSQSIINFVFRTGESILIDDAQNDDRFRTDNYLQQNGVRSVLCVPVRYKNTIRAIAYFENNLAPGTFTENRFYLVTTLASQAAISIENALLYANLEKMVAERTRELEVEQKKADLLLRNILPSEIAEELKEKGQASAKMYERATIFFCDFRNFTQLAESIQPAELVKLIDFYFCRFDEIMQRYEIEKIKTVGDAYIAAGGLPDTTKGSPLEVVQAAIDIQKLVQSIQTERQANNLPFFEVRIGIHTGPVIAGVVGRIKFAYDIWGDTVNTAARLEENSLPGKINISGTTYLLVKERFRCTYRGKIPAKHKGEIDMYFVEEAG
jgi:histidine kinase